MAIVIVDASVWIDHLDRGRQSLVKLDASGATLVLHEMVWGELMMGNLAERHKTKLRRLEFLHAESTDAVCHLVTQQRLYGTGLQWADAHILCSALVHGAIVYSTDNRLAAAARRLKVA